MRIPLNDGAYQARSVIASAQRCINLYAEKNPQDSPVPFTYYPTPGLTLLNNAPITAISRGGFRASNGSLYRVVGQNVYYVDSSWNHNLLGSIYTSTGICSFSDNGLAIILVDGSTTGYAINMQTNAFAVISDPNFLGANKVDYIDTFFVLNKPGTYSFYSSLSEVSYTMLTSLYGSILSGTITDAGTGYTPGFYGSTPLTGGTGTGAVALIQVASTGVVISVNISTPGSNYTIGDALTATLPGGSGFSYTIGGTGGSAFYSLDIASKVGSPDPLVSLIVMHQEIWLLGQLTSEIWYNAGSAPFPFQQMPQGFVEHGLVAQNSLTRQDTFIYWLSQDREGRAIVLRGASYVARRISTHAIETAISSYSTISDAIGFTYQQQGHTFYFLTFPTANATWVFDESTEQWHERTYTDNNGNLNASLVNGAANAYGYNVCFDAVNGNLYAFDLNNYTDNGQPISRIRSFAHILEDNCRISYSAFYADMDVGNDTLAEIPMVSLRWSDDRGNTYGNAVEQSLGAGGQYLTNMQWRRLGLARDRVFELSWSAATKTALNGAFIEIQKLAT